MIKNFKRTKYFNYLLENSSKIDNERIEFNAEIFALLNRQLDELGTILKCHLIIENYIDRYLMAAYPTVVAWEQVRLSFSQKLELINCKSTPVAIYYPAIKCLNSIRNKFSHRISYQVERKDYEEIETIMTVWYNALNEPVLQHMKLIEHFTVWVCGNLNSIINGINTHSKKLGLPSYLEWLRSMQRTTE